MNPQQQPPSYGVDYLNQIAPQSPKKGWLTKKHKIAAAVLVGVILLVIIMGIIANSSNNTSPAKTLAARLAATETIVGDAQSQLKSSELRTLNSNLKIYLTNTNRDIVAPLKSAGIDATKIDAKITAKESGAAITAALEEARLNAVYDRTYAREIAYQLEKIVLLMRQLYSSTNKTSLKTFLDSAYKNLEPTQKAFSEFNAANG